jgi:hypothetical protein
MISGHDVAQHFGSAGAAERELNRWCTRRGRQHIATRVLEHVSRQVHEVRPQEIQDLATSHPLGNLHPPQGYKVPGIKNWHPGFAFTHLFHFCLEDLEGIFSFDQFLAWSRDPARSGWLWDPMMQIINSRRTDEARRDASASIRWRIGLAYYGFLREVYVVASLRSLGVLALSHPLADALFRTDTWCGTTVVEVFIENDEFKRNQHGRKPTAEDLLGDQVKFSFERLQMPNRHEFGRVHLPDDRAIAELALRMQALPAR